jgi:hypothetical protein
MVKTSARSIAFQDMKRILDVVSAARGPETGTASAVEAASPAAEAPASTSPASTGARGFWVWPQAARAARPDNAITCRKKRRIVISWDLGPGE